MVPVPVTVVPITSTRGAVPGYRYIKGAGADTGTEVPVPVPVPVPVTGTGK